MSSSEYRVFGNGCVAILLHCDYGDAEKLALELPAKIIALPFSDANENFTPWPSPGIFPTGGDFGGGADAHLDFILREVLPHCAAQHYMIAGYSLAGLFALYAAGREPVFEAAAGVSASLWYPHFTDWLKEAPRMPSKVYLSVGNREKYSRSFASIEERLIAAGEIYRLKGSETKVVIEKGGHFTEPFARTLRALQYLLGVK